MPDYLLFLTDEIKATAARLPQAADRYGLGASLVEAKAWSLPLDRAGADQAGAPSTQVLRYLGTVGVQSGDAVRFGILTNGRLWRLYDNKARSRLEGFVEIDLMEAAGLVMPATGAGPDHADRMLAQFLFLFGRDAFAPDTGGDTRLARAIAASRDFEARVTDDLADKVFAGVFPDLANALAFADPGRPAALTPAYLAELREATLTWLYRLLFVLYAEDRSLLPTRARRDGLWSMRNDVARSIDAGEALSARRTNHDGDLRALWAQIDGGDDAIGLPPYNGGLFRPGRSPLLDRAVMPDAAVAPLLDALSRERLGEHPRFINYRDLNVQHLGSVYERLLEFDLAEVDDRIAARPQTFARKTSGSYYTPEELVLLVIRRTVGPLLAEREAAFAAAVQTEAGTAQAREAPAYPLARLRDHDPASAFLMLRIVDPAMGSGHFLVSLVDYFADRTMLATEDAAAAVGFGEYRSPLLDRLEAIRTRIRTQAAEHRWRVEEDQLVDRQLVRRIILKRVIHGVDKNPMAVELAKLSLWLHTFTVGAPLSFLDHHLRCGDSLFGEWVGPGMTTLEQGGLFVADDLKAAQRSIVEMEMVEELTDADIVEVKQSEQAFGELEARTAALAGKLALLQGYRWIGESTESALKRAKALQREADRSTDPKQSFDLARQAWEMKRKGSALDVLLGGQLGELTAVLDFFYGRVATLPAGTKPDDPALEPLAAAAEIARTANFLSWELAFPNVWRDWRSARPTGGFDAVIGNPPWDRLKMQEVEWFAAREPTIAYQTNASQRKARVAALRAMEDPLAAQYDRASRFAAMAGRMANLPADRGGDFPLLGGGDVNLYSLFVERAQRLVRPGGIVGLLTPSGIAGDLSASRFFKSISTTGRLGCLLDFANRPASGIAEFFPDVDSRFKICVIVFGGGERRFPAARCGFFLAGTGNAALDQATFPLTPNDFAAVNPNSGTAPVFRIRRDAELTTAIYGRLPVLVRHAANKATRDVAAWPVRYRRMFDMTNDSHLFRTRADLEADGWYSKQGTYGLSKGEARAVPLYVGRMFWQFDHRASNVTVNEKNLHNPANSETVTVAEKQRWSFEPEPQYWVDWDDVKPQRTWTLAFRDIARPTDARTIISAVLPGTAYGNTAGLILLDDPRDVGCLSANLNSMALDYVARQKLQGTHANWYIIEQLPVIPPDAYTRTFGPLTAAQIVAREVLALTYTAHDMAPFARDMGHVDPATGEVLPPFRWDESDRRQRRARLDALYFHLYGIGRTDADYILSTFPIVRRHDERDHGRFLTRDLILAHMAALDAGDPDATIVLR
ncbi:Eco57I restriction-modification methylase domain-containing protein [Sphingomonas bacterium]|uniref:Eco57I restriction-modification methylase domain-containing protein n=1 Tax=Sphingomonas bacterium TaxID=1895847 RepID=UPI001575D96D|nr:restriction endonuclease [Sphingomonas bacterium]